MTKTEVTTNVSTGEQTKASSLPLKRKVKANGNQLAKKQKSSMPPSSAITANMLYQMLEQQEDVATIEQQDDSEAIESENKDIFNSSYPYPKLHSTALKVKLQDVDVAPMWHVLRLNREQKDDYKVPTSYLPELNRGQQDDSEATESDNEAISGDPENADNSSYVQQTSHFSTSRTEVQDKVIEGFQIPGQLVQNINVTNQKTKGSNEKNVKLLKERCLEALRHRFKPALLPKEAIEENINKLKMLLHSGSKSKNNYESFIARYEEEVAGSADKARLILYHQMYDASCPNKITEYTSLASSIIATLDLSLISRIFTQENMPLKWTPGTVHPYLILMYCEQLSDKWKSIQSYFASICNTNIFPTEVEESLKKLHKYKTKEGNYKNSALYAYLQHPNFNYLTTYITSIGEKMYNTLRDINKDKLYYLWHAQIIYNFIKNDMVFFG